jgi:cation:H+ antiporter
LEHLIDQLAAMHWSLLLVVGSAAMYAIIKGADWLVEGASGMALRLGISKVIVGATIVSLGTTSPECAVSVLAAFKGNSGLALGNAVGSIIADTGLIFGIGCLMMGLPVDRFILNRQGWVQFGSGIGLAALCYGAWVAQGREAALGRPAGLLMLLALVWYLTASVRWGRQHAELTARVHGEPEEIMEHARHDPWAKLVVFFLLGLAMVIVFGHVLIGAIEKGAELARIPDVVISSTIVAFGTSLPELMVGITAIRRGHPQLLIGNVIGADILNVLFVVGASATAARLPIVNPDPDAPAPAIFLYLHLPTMLVILTLFRLYIHTAVRRGHFQRWFGVPLIAIYLTYLALNYVLSRT